MKKWSLKLILVLCALIGIATISDEINENNTNYHFESNKEDSPRVN